MILLDEPIWSISSIKKEGVLDLDKLNIIYRLDDVPPIGELVLFGLQWLAIAIPSIIIIGKVVTGLHFSDFTREVIYLQRLTLVIGLSLVIQVVLGHRLPLIIGPASVLLVGVITALDVSYSAIYTSILLGGLILFILGLTGIIARLSGFFSSRVVAVILLLIAFTLTPTILGLIVESPNHATSFYNLGFALVSILGLFFAHRFSSGIFRSTLIIWYMILGTLIYQFSFPRWGEATSSLSMMPSIFTFFPVNFAFSLDLGVLLAFILCFFALSINDLGSIQSVSELLNADQKEKRLTRGICVTGLTNALSGWFGVIGSVNFSLSPGVIASTGCASRFTLIPTGLGLIVISLFPGFISAVSLIPSVIIGTVLLYIMSSQVSAGLLVAFNKAGGFQFDDGLIIGLPLMLGTMISYLPQKIVATFPEIVRPLVGNGFVVGVLVVLILEHIIFRSQKQKNKVGH
jgi:xanthine/uracil permease